MPLPWRFIPSAAAPSPRFCCNCDPESQAGASHNQQCVQQQQPALSGAASVNRTGAMEAALWATESQQRTLLLLPADTLVLSMQVPVQMLRNANRARF